MRYLIDSDVYIEFLWKDPGTTHLVEELLPAGVAISIVTYMESYQGTFRRPDPIASQTQAASIIGRIPVLPFSLETAERCARLRHDLSTQGRRVRSRVLDLMIAATALEYNLALVTRNRADYEDIPGLALA
jgi:tRNA(fMet)-specific endonuclease VapC